MGHNRAASLSERLQALCPAVCGEAIAGAAKALARRKGKKGVQMLHGWRRGFRQAVQPECSKLSRRQGCEGLGASEALTRLPRFLGKSEVLYPAKISHNPQRSRVRRGLSLGVFR